ncbi:MAG: YdcF family protein [Polyangiaceae bacterium]
MNRIADVLFEPLFAALALLVLSYVLSKRAPRLAFALPAAALAILVVFSAPAVSNGLQRGLEQPPLTTMRPDAIYDTVIVLGGATNPPVTAETGRPSFNDAVERLLTAFDLLRTNRARSAILSGGNWPGVRPDIEPEAHIMAEQLEAWGIDPARLVIDTRSTNTHENAVESVRIARERGWTRDLLVTSAAHMQRARGCFLREGLEVDTLSVDFRANDPARSSIGWLPRAAALADSTAAIRERVGRFVYRMRGWSL